MSIATREEAAQHAEADRTNEPGTCQMETRGWFNAPSAGDRDHDGDADAVDGWLSEPVSARHPGDRNPPRGVPVAWAGGSHGNGHRAISLGGGKIRSTDAGGSGHVATVDLSWPEEHWGLHYLGWSETIDGLPIPGGKTPAPTPAPAPHKRLAFDYSFARPDLEPFAKAGFRFVIRYVPIGSKKDLTAAEVKRIHDAGLGLVVVFETTVGRATQGSTAGKADVARAEAAMDRLGYPDYAAIFYAVDSDVTAAVVRPYFQAVAAGAKRPVGVYGSFQVVEGLVGGGVVKHGWQTEAWSHGQVSRHASMLQRATKTMSVPGVPGTSWDLNELRGPRKWRIWLNPADAPAPKPTPEPTPPPAPKPPKPSSGFHKVIVRAGAHNGQVGHHIDEKQTDINRIEPQLDLNGLSEWGTYGHVHPAPGMHRFDGDGKPGQVATPIDYRPSIFVPGTITTGALLLTGPEHIGDAGPGPATTKTKWLMWVHGQLASNGRWLRFCCLHGVPTPHLNAARESVGDEQIDDVGAQIEKWQGEGIVVLVGDFNRRVKDPDLDRLTAVGMTIVASTGVMLVLVKMKEAGDQRITHVETNFLDGGHSDHDVPVAALTVAPAGAV